MTDLVIGVGEVGGPLADLLMLERPVIRRDIKPPQTGVGRVEVMHVCFPCSDGFKADVVEYILEYEPELTIIHSTVVPGTTRDIAGFTDGNVAYSPVRGRHCEMTRDLVRYTKFLAAPNSTAERMAQRYFEQLGLFRYEIMYPVEALELAKLVETTYSALLISFAQELYRYGDALNANPDDVLEFTKEVDYLPRHAFFPGYIGGHCIMQNLDLLEQVRESPFIRAIRESNEACPPWRRTDGHRYRPRRL